jgi:hypothetical protein
MTKNMASGHKFLMEADSNILPIVGNPWGIFRTAAQASPNPLI